MHKKDDKARQKLGLTGFTEGSDSLYDGVRESIKASKEFEGQSGKGEG